MKAAIQAQIRRAVAAAATLTLVGGVKQCEEAQGYLYAKPLDADGFEAFLRMRRPEQVEMIAERPFSRRREVATATVRAPRRRRLPKA